MSSQTLASRRKLAKLVEVDVASKNKSIEYKFTLLEFLDNI